MANFETQNFSQPFYSGVFTYHVEVKKVNDQERVSLPISVYVTSRLIFCWLFLSVFHSSNRNWKRVLFAHQLTVILTNKSISKDTIKLSAALWQSLRKLSSKISKSSLSDRTISLSLMDLWRASSNWRSQLKQCFSVCASRIHPRIKAQSRRRGTLQNSACPATRSTETPRDQTQICSNIQTSS